MYACLYTKHKTQKHKKWQDGRLVIRGAVAHLHSADPMLGGGDPRLDACEVVSMMSGGGGGGSLVPGQMIEMENHLVTVEGPWTGSVASSAAAASTTAIAPIPPKPLPKFRKPPVRPPPPPPPSSAVPSQMMNRKRPLQPGELQQQYYGVQGDYHHHHLNPLPSSGPSPTHSHAQQWSGSAMHPSHVPVAASYPLEPPAAGLDYSPYPHRHLPLPLPQSSAPFHARVPSPAPQRRPMAHPSSAVDPRGTHPMGPLYPRNAPPVVATDVGTRATTVTTDKENVSRSNLAAQAFAGNNGFDPSRFYGDDEEEEEDEQENVDRENESWGGAWGMAGSDSMSDVATKTNTPQRNDAPPEMGSPPPDARGVEAASFSGTLSEDQLLDLFGVPPDPSASSVVSPPSAASTEAPSRSLPPTNTGTTRAAPLDAADFTLPDDDDSSSSSSSTD